MRHTTIAALFPAIALAAVLHAQAPDTQPATRGAGVMPAPASRPALGPKFESKTAGIGFYPPADMEQFKQPGPVENVVHFVNEKARASLRVTRVVLQQPQSLMPRDSVDPETKKPVKIPGLLDVQETQLAGPPIMGKVLRKDVINAGKEGTVEVGMLAARYVTGPQFFLRQQALVRYDLTPPTAHGALGSKAGAAYFIFDYTTPSGKTSNDAAAEETVDPLERQAVESFAQVIETIELYDLRPIVRDAERRLDATRTLLFNTNAKKIAASLVPERCFLIWQGGKQIGYSYVTEQTATREAREGVLIGMRTRTFPKLVPLDPDRPAGAPALPDKVDAISEMFCTPDRKYETWASVLTYHMAAQANAPAPALPRAEQVREFGQTTFSSRRVFEEVPGPGGVPMRVKGADGNPKFRMQDQYTLTVTQFMKTGNVPPIDRDLPPYYAPQAFGHLLPRLLPLSEARGYLVAFWVSEQKELIRRYLDVERPRRVVLGSATVEAIPVKDRIGLEGVPTYHYFSPLPEGRYLGSVTEGTKMAVLAARPEDIKKLDPNADLSAPPRALNIGGRENK